VNQSRGYSAGPASIGYSHERSHAVVIWNDGEMFDLIASGLMPSELAAGADAVRTLPA